VKSRLLGLRIVVALFQPDIAVEIHLRPAAARRELRGGALRGCSLQRFPGNLPLRLHVALRFQPLGAAPAPKSSAK